MVKDTKKKLSQLNPIRAGVFSPPPLQGFLVLLPNGARCSVHTWWLFPTIRCTYLWKKIDGSRQVRSPERVG